MSFVEGEVMSLLDKIRHINPTAARELEGQCVFFLCFCLVFFLNFTEMVSVLEETEMYLLADSFKMLFLWA